MEPVHEIQPHGAGHHQRAQPLTSLPTGIPSNTGHCDHLPSQDSYQLSDTPLLIYDIVRSSGVPNYLGARIPLPHKLCIPAWRAYLATYLADPLLCDYLAYGWPINYTSPVNPTPTNANHASALAYPQHVDDYLAKEVHHGAI